MYSAQPPVEWVFEVEDGQAEEVLVPPPSGPSNSWLSWLQGSHQHPEPGFKNFSRESDVSAPSLPCESRDPDALPPGSPRDGGDKGVFGFMGLGAWPDALGLNEQESRSMLAMRNVTARRFAEPDNPLPPPMPSRMDAMDDSDHLYELQT
eukprot:g1687.t1